MRSIETRLEKLEEAMKLNEKLEEPFPVIDTPGLSEDEIFAEAERKHLRFFALIPSSKRILESPQAK